MPRFATSLLAWLWIGSAAFGQPAAWGPPPAWPAGVPAPAEVTAAQAALEDVLAAVRTVADGLQAEVRFGPRLDLLWRDDPPRPLRASLAGLPEASLTWSPLQSEVLLHEARAVEAEARLRSAWRAALVEAWRAPVEAARALAALERAAEAHEAAESAWRAAEANGVEAARQAEGARLAWREAELALRIAARDAAPWLAGDPPLAGAGLTPAAAEAWSLLTTWTPGGSEAPDLDAGERRALRWPRGYEPEGSRDFLARAFREEAVLSRAERERIAAVMPSLSLQSGYAGTAAGVSAALELRGGRPRAEVAGTLSGTIQERFWLRAGATFRLGSDLSSAREAVQRAEAGRDETLAELARRLAADVTAAQVAAEDAEARWRIEEDRLAWERVGGDPARIRRQEDRVRQRYLQYLTAAARVWERADAWPQREAPPPR